MSNGTGAPAGDRIEQVYGGQRGLSGNKTQQPECGDHAAFLWVMQAVTITVNMPICLLVKE